MGYKSNPGAGPGYVGVIRPGEIIPSTNFSNPMPNGVANLSGPITINGQTVEPMFRYNGKDVVPRNTAPYSEDFSEYGLTEMTVDSANVNHPITINGVTGYMDGLIGSNVSGGHVAAKHLVENPDGNGRQTASLYVKAGATPYGILYLYASPHPYAWFDLSLGVIKFGANGDGKMEAVGDDIWRIQFTPTLAMAAAATHFWIQPALSYTVLNYTGDGSTVDLWVYGAQCIYGTSPGDYQGPTTTTAVGGSWPADGYGSTIPISSTGSDPSVNQGSPLLGSRDDSVMPTGNGKTYQMASAATYDITTEDFVWEAMWEAETRSAGAYSSLMTKQATPHINFYVTENGANNVFIQLSGADSAASGSSAALDNGWNHALVFADRSGYFQIYINGVASGSPVDISGLGSLTTSGEWTVLCNTITPTNADYKPTRPVAYLAMYIKDNWLDTHLQAAFAKERFAQLTGGTPLSTRGTAVPTVATRASAGYLSKSTSGVIDLYNTGDNWIRQERVEDINGTEKVCEQIEPASQNIAKYSEAFNSFTQGNCSTDQDNVAQPAPVDGKYFDGLIGDNDGAAAHYYTITTTTENLFEGKNVWSIYMKKGTHAWVRMTVYVASIGTGYHTTYYDLENGVIGSPTGEAHTAGIIDCGDYYRCWLTPTADCGDETMNIFFYIADSDGDATTVGDGASVMAWFFGFQIEPGTYPTSYIGPTVTTTVTRAADVYYHNLAATRDTTVNIAAYSEDIDSWDTKARCSVDSANTSHPSPVGGYFDGLIPNTDNNTHGLQTESTDSTIAGKYCTSVYLKKGAKDWALLLHSSVPAGHPNAFFDLDNGVVGTVDACSAGIEDVGNGIYRCWISNTTNYGAAASYPTLYAAEDDEDYSFIGDNTNVDVWASGWQLELGTTPSPYVGPTTTTAVTGYYNIKPEAIQDGKGAVSFNLLVPDHTPPAAIEVLELSDGGDSADRIRIYVHTDGTIKAAMDATGGTTRTATVAGDCADGVWHSIHLQWQAGQLVIRRDGVAGTDIVATVAADIPDDLDRLTRGTVRIGQIQTYLQPYYPGE